MNTKKDLKDTNSNGAVEQSISYEELKKHASYVDAWISIDGVVYDITAFMHKHPFGDTFRGSLGTECGGLFAGSHINTNADKLLENDTFLANNDIIKIGRLDVSHDYLYKNNDDRFLDRLVYKDMKEDSFWQDLKTEVQKYLKDNNESIHYSAAVGRLYLLYYSLIFVLLSYLCWFQGSFIAAVLLGFHMVCAATNMAHMVTHFGFTKNKLLDFVAAHFFDLGGLSWLEWQIIHQTHHNQPHSSIDYQTNQYVIRIHAYVKHKSQHRYQHIYFWFSVFFYHLFSVPTSTLWMFKNTEFVRHGYELAAHLLTRLILFSMVFYCIYLFGFWYAALLFFCYSVSYSFTAFLLLYNDHEDTHKVLSKTANINHYHQQMSWAEVQVRTSNNWYPNNWLLAFIEFHYGYFNFHIEHHLFPTFKPILLKRISPIVRQVCKKHDIPYILTTFVEVQKSFQRHIIKMGRPPEKKVVS